MYQLAYVPSKVEQHDIGVPLKSRKYLTYRPRQKVFVFRDLGGKWEVKRIVRPFTIRLFLWKHDALTIVQY